eukprot:6036126-Prymnesium_polylepis.1
MSLSSARWSMCVRDRQEKVPGESHGACACTGSTPPRVRAPPAASPRNHRQMTNTTRLVPNDQHHPL